MAHVDHHHVEAAGLGSGGGLAKLVGDVIDLRLGHLLHRVPPLVHVAGGADGVLPADELRGAQGTAVVDLHRGGSPAGVDGLRHLHQVGNRSGIVQPHLLGVGAAGVQVHDYVPHRHQGAAAGGLEAVVVEVGLGVVLLRAQLRQGSRGRQQPVLQRQPRQAQGPEQVFIGMHHITQPFFCRFSVLCLFYCNMARAGLHRAQA